MFGLLGDKSKYVSNNPFVPFSESTKAHLHYFGNDWHIGSKYNDNPLLEVLVKIWLGRSFTPEDYEKARNSFGEVAQPLTYNLIVKLRIYLNGDVVDLKCCPHNKLSYYMQMHDDLVSLFNPPGKEPHLNDGNHCVRVWITKDWHERYIKIVSPSGRVMAIEHGHRLLDELKGKPKWQKYCDKPCGANKWDLIKTDILDDMDWLKAKRPLPKGFTDFADQRAFNLGADIISFAHFHTEGQRWYKKARSHVHINPAHTLNHVWF